MAYSVRREAAHVVGVHVDAHTVAACRADILGLWSAVTHIEHDSPTGEVPVDAIVKAVERAGAASDEEVVVGVPQAARLADGPPDDTPAQVREELRRALGLQLGMNIRVLPNVGLAGIAEAHLGMGRGVASFLMLEADPDLIMSVLIGGVLHEGATGAAGTLRRNSSGELVLALINACAVLDPACVVLGTSLVRNGEQDMVKRIQIELAANLTTPPDVVSTTFTDDPVLVGALHVALVEARKSVLHQTDETSDHNDA